MSLKTFIVKWEAQLKALNPKYDVHYEVSKDEPIVFKDSENVKLSFATIADTHLIDNEASEKNLANVFEDIGNSKEKFDAFLMAGDIAEYGLKKEYKRFFRVVDNQKVIPYNFVTMGNHDVRFFYSKNQKIIMDKVNQHLKINTNGKSFYSYDINGYTFIVIGTEKRVLEKAHITKSQIDFLDKELERGTKDGKPVFVMCHQAFAETHGLPEVWKTGDMGEQNDEVRAVMEKYTNVFFINGHLHGGIGPALTQQGHIGTGHHAAFGIHHTENTIRCVLQLNDHALENTIGHYMLLLRKVHKHGSYKIMILLYIAFQHFASTF